MHSEGAEGSRARWALLSLVFLLLLKTAAPTPLSASRGAAAAWATSPHVWPPAGAVRLAQRWARSRTVTLPWLAQANCGRSGRDDGGERTGSQRRTEAGSQP